MLHNVIKKENVKKLLAAMILREWTQSRETGVFDFKTLYSDLCVNCVEFDIPLQDIRVAIGAGKHPALEKDMTLLHLMVKISNVEAVKILTSDVATPKNLTTIPRDVTHPSTYTLLHYCGLWAKNDWEHIMQNNDPTKNPLNVKLIEIAKILSDDSKPDHLPIAVTRSVRNSNGRTPAHSAANVGAYDFLHFLFYKDHEAFTIIQDDKATPLDLIVNNGPCQHLMPLSKQALQQSAKDPLLTDAVKAKLMSMYSATRYFFPELKKPAKVMSSALNNSNNCSASEAETQAASLASTNNSNTQVAFLLSPNPSVRQMTHGEFSSSLPDTNNIISELNNVSNSNTTSNITSKNVNTKRKEDSSNNNIFNNNNNNTSVASNNDQSFVQENENTNAKRAKM